MRQQAGKTEEQIVAEQTAGIDARFFCGVPDVSELPGAYKSAASVRAQIAEFGLAEVVDTIEPNRIHHGRRLAAPCAVETEEAHDLRLSPRR